MADIERWWMIVRPDKQGLHGHTYEDEAIARQVAAAGLGEDVIAVVPAAQLEGAVGVIEQIVAMPADSSLITSNPEARMRSLAKRWLADHAGGR